jgi:NAD(P)-dependent dehydrogenase (short-subunit alcohol dehydrogenase family)
MLPLICKNVVVIGGSRGVGRRIVEGAIRNGARVLAVARREVPLRQLAQEVCGTEVLSLDATDEAAPSKVFEVLQPDILVLCGGAFPPASPLHEQSWQEFAKLFSCGPPESSLVGYTCAKPPSTNSSVPVM